MKALDFPKINCVNLYYQQLKINIARQPLEKSIFNTKGIWMFKINLPQTVIKMPFDFIEDIPFSAMHV